MANVTELAPTSALGDATDDKVLAGATYTSAAGVARSGTFDPSAENISYDNTTSGMTAENVQEAVDELASGKAPAYTYGTEDMTAGTSELETGKLYFMYEE